MPGEEDVGLCACQEDAGGGRRKIVELCACQEDAGGGRRRKMPGEDVGRCRGRRTLNYVHARKMPGEEDVRF